MYGRNTTIVPRASRKPAAVLSSGQNLVWKLCVKDKCVKQESRTLDLEWRDSASLAQKRNNGSHRDAERWQLDQSITRSQTIKTRQNTTVNSQSTE